MGKLALWGAVGVLAGFVLISIVVAVLPRDFFTRTRSSKGWVKVFKNVLGAALILAGVALSLPLVPGPGFVLLLVGLALVDFPGRRKLLRKAILRPSVHRKLNAFRRKLHRPYFLLPES
jgi:hypothetical protein